MKKKEKKKIHHFWNKRKMAKGIFLLVLFLFLVVSLGLWVYHFAAYWGDNERECRNIQETTVESIHTLNGLQNSLAAYPIFRKTMQAYKNEKDHGTYVIPGLEVAHTMRAGAEDVCTNMTPQSVCVAENYLLIGAYCRTHTHYSVIYVLDKTTHEYIKTIVLPGRHHVGGLAYDEEHKMLWISCFDEIAQANAISLKQIIYYDYDVCHHPITFRYVTDLYTIPKDSFLAYYDGYLYIGYFQLNESSILEKFRITKKGKIAVASSGPYQASYEKPLPPKIAVPTNVMSISSKVQGIAFSSYRMYITESYGIFESKIAIFRVRSDSAKDQSYTNENAIGIIRMPPKLEQITVCGDDIYTIYESAAYSYRYYTFPSIDRVLKMKIFDVSELAR